MESGGYKEKIGLKEICGVLHIHTRYSDGNSSVEDVINTAKNLGLDYVCINDHMTLKAREKGVNGFHGNLFVEVGYEHNDKNNKNHYLVMGVEKVAKSQDIPQNYINEVKDMGGIGFLAHPAEARKYFSQYPPYPWTEWDVQDYDGIELWNQFSDWVENLKSVLSYIKIFYPRRFLRSAPKRLIEKWDSLSKKRFIAAIGGVDAHTINYKSFFLNISIFPLKVELKGIRTHLYVEKDFFNAGNKKGEKILLNALKRGNGFVCNYRRGDGRNTEIFYIDSNDNIFMPGINYKSMKPGGYIHVNIPQKAEIIFIKNGKKEGYAKSREIMYPINEAGVYRIEVKKGRNTWIYSNHFPIGEYPFE